MQNTPGTEEQLRNELDKLNAREFEVVALTMDPDRGLAALNYAQERGVDYPIPYAIKIFDSSDWHPKGEVRRRVTNDSVDVKCEHCDGDRFVVVTDDWRKLWGESYAPCARCNADADTSFFRADGLLLRTQAR